MDREVIRRLERSFEALAPRGPELVDHFYNKLFGDYPQIRSMFPQDMAEQKNMLLAALALVVRNLRTQQRLAAPLREMGRRHTGYGVQPEHYPVVRDTLVSVMAELAGPIWTDELDHDWRSAIDWVASVMLEGAAAAVPAGCS
ncbi:MAG: flavohemoprotein [bacterium]|nr:flavohemoprotein [bacterium]